MTDKITNANSDTILFSNSTVTCYSDRLVIHYYYFPIGHKTIKYNQIQSCALLEMRDLSFLKTKLWGMGLSSIWWHADFYRDSRRYCLLLDANQWPQIGLTMDDDDLLKVDKLVKNKLGMTMNEPTGTSLAYETKAQ